MNAKKRNESRRIIDWPYFTSRGLYFRNRHYLRNRFMVSKNGSGYAGALPTRLGVIFQGAMQLKPYAVLMLGIFLLILTPSCGSWCQSTPLLRKGIDCT